MPSPWRPVLSLALLTAIWGFSVPIMKLGRRDRPPLGLVSLRYLGAAPFLLCFLLARRLPPPRALGALVGLAALGPGAGPVLQIAGVRRRSGVVATIITATRPIFTVLFAAVRLHQPVRARHPLALALALAGIALATMSASAGTSSAATLGGDALLLLSCLCVAAYYVVGAELPLTHGVTAASAWSTVFTALLLLAIGEIVNGESHWTPAAISVRAYLGLLVTVLGIWIWLHAVRTVPVRVAASSQYAQPLIGICASAAIFGTAPGPGFIVGTLLVLGGIALTNLARMKP